MKYISLFIFSLLLSSFTINDNKHSALHLSFTDYKPGKGSIYIRLGNEKDELIKTIRVDLSTGREGYKFSNLPPGKYTVRCFQDLNGNKELDKNFMGIPVEPYGFANNPKIRFGPPSIKEQTVEVSGHKKLIIVFKS